MPSKSHLAIYFGTIILLISAFVLLSGDDQVKTYHYARTHSFYVKEDMTQSKKGVMEILNQLGYGCRSNVDSIICQWQYDEIRDDGFDRETNKLVFTFNINNVTGSLERTKEFTHHPAIESDEDLLGKVVLLYQERYPPDAGK